MYGRRSRAAASSERWRSTSASAKRSTLAAWSWWRWVSTRWSTSAGERPCSTNPSRIGSAPPSRIDRPATSPRSAPASTTTTGSSGSAGSSGNGKDRDRRGDRHVLVEQVGEGVLREIEGATADGVDGVHFVSPLDGVGGKATAGRGSGVERRPAESVSAGRGRPLPHGEYLLLLGRDVDRLSGHGGRLRDPAGRDRPPDGSVLDGDGVAMAVEGAHVRGPPRDGG